MKKNKILLIELLFALLSIWVLTATHQRPESALITLRVYVLVMIGVTGALVLMFRHYLTHHSTIDITRICETVRNLDVPAFIWTNDLNTIYTNEAMDDILGISPKNKEDPRLREVLQQFDKLVEELELMGIEKEKLIERMRGGDSK